MTKEGGHTYSSSKVVKHVFINILKYKYMIYVERSVYEMFVTCVSAWM